MGRGGADGAQTKGLGMKRLILAPLALILAGCNGSADGYQFGDPEFERAKPNIEIVTYESVSAVRAAAPKGAHVEGRDLMAWAVLRKDGCTIHVLDPSVSYQPEWLGHEVAHCVWGRWHD